jgi:hypothetical protein
VTNGSEHIPEATNYQKLAQDLRTLGGEGFMATDQYSRVPYGFLYRAADAVESLLVENEKLRAKLEMPCGSCHPCTQWANQTWVNAGLRLPHVIDWQELTAERDALQAQLDAACAHPFSRVKFDGGKNAVVCNTCNAIISHLTAVEGEQSNEV